MFFNRIIRDLKILDAVAFKNVVASEMRPDLCCASGRQNTLQQTDSVKESPESGVFAAMMLFKTTWELLAGCYLAFLISDEEFVLLYVCSFSKNLELLYEEYKRNGRFGVQSRVPYE